MKNDAEILLAETYARHIQSHPFRRTIMRLVSGVFLACLTVTAAIVDGQSAPPRGLVPLEAVRIQETDTLFLSRPAQMVLGPRGHVYLTEGREARVLDIGPGGRIERVFGRKGRGPGEFVSPTAITTSGDTLLAVYDHATKRVTFIDIPRWTLQSVSPLLTQWPPVIKFADGDLMVSAWDFDTKTSIAQTVEGTGALDERQGIIPSLGAQTQMLIAGAFWNSTFAPIGDEIFAMYEVSSSLYRWNRGARDAREVVLPAIRRRGIPPGLFESLLRDPAKATPAMIYDRSVPVVIAQVSDDIVAIVTMDVKVDADRWSGIHYISLYDRRRDRVCVDLAVPASRVKVALARDPLPVVALRGDTLALLEQAETAVGEPVQLLRRYRIEPADCEWIAIKP